MKQHRVRLAIFLLALTTSACALSPYAGEENHSLKSLSPQQIDNYLQGAGMGYARAAELNHYPGPRHVLELAARLDLTDQQRKRTTAIFDAMQEKAITYGKQLVSAERELDQQFSNGNIDEQQLSTKLAEIAKIEGEIRFAHLQAHLQQKAVLTPQQVHRYDKLRGYGNGGATSSKHNHQH